MASLQHHRDVLIPDLFWENDTDELRKELLSSFTAGRDKDREDAAREDAVFVLKTWSSPVLGGSSQLVSG